MSPASNLNKAASAVFSPFINLANIVRDKYEEFRREQALSIAFGIAHTNHFSRPIPSPAFKNPPIVIVREYRIIQQPGDGNCLFNSFARGLLEPNIKVPGELNKNQLRLAQELRKQSIDWLEANWENDPYDEVKNLLMTTIKDTLEHRASIMEDHLEYHRANLEENNASLRSARSSSSAMAFMAQESIIKEQILITEKALKICQDEANNVMEEHYPYYFKAARQEKFYCHIAEIFALSKIYKVDVKIFQEMDNKWVEIVYFSHPENINNPMNMIRMSFDPHLLHYNTLMDLSVP